MIRIMFDIENGLQSQESTLFEFRAYFDLPKKLPGNWQNAPLCTVAAYVNCSDECLNKGLSNGNTNF